jgi:hypothetical protein
MQHVFTQTPGVRVADVVDPALHAGIELGEGDLPGAVVGLSVRQLPREGDHVARLDPAGQSRCARNAQGALRA